MELLPIWKAAVSLFYLLLTLNSLTDTYHHWKILDLWRLREYGLHLVHRYRLTCLHLQQSNRRRRRTSLPLRFSRSLGHVCPQAYHRRSHQPTHLTLLYGRRFSFGHPRKRLYRRTDDWFNDWWWTGCRRARLERGRSGKWRMRVRWQGIF